MHTQAPTNDGYGYAHGSWGYTVLRTVYTPESDTLFPAAIERLKKYVHFWCHYGRFPSYGEYAESRAIAFAEPNDEISRRFYLDVIEDEGLADLDGDGLGDYFRQWVAGVLNSGPKQDWNPRFCSYLVIDAESLASLAQIPDEPPPLRCAKDVKEKQGFLSAGEGAWVWLLDTLPRLASDEDSYRGWLRVELRDIELSWFDRRIRWTCGEESPFYREEKPPGSGIFYYSADYVGP
jgi:hypothetical protein